MTSKALFRCRARGGSGLDPGTNPATNAWLQGLTPYVARRRIEQGADPGLDPGDGLKDPHLSPEVQALLDRGGLLVAGAQGSCLLALPHHQHRLGKQHSLRVLFKQKCEWVKWCGITINFVASTAVTSVWPICRCLGRADPARCPQGPPDLSTLYLCCSFARRSQGFVL